MWTIMWTIVGENGREIMEKIEREHVSLDESFGQG